MTMIHDSDGVWRELESELDRKADQWDQMRRAMERAEAREIETALKELGYAKTQ